MDKKNNSSFVIGVLIGAALTYLFTTENGRRIKSELIKEGSKLLDKVGDSLEEMEEDYPQIKKAEDKLIAAKEEIRDITHEVLGGEEPEPVEQIHKKGRHFFFKKSHAQGES